MTKKEKQMAAYWLDKYADDLGNNSCNDVDEEVWIDWSLFERRKFAKAYHKYNGDPEDYDKDNLELPDFCIVGFLASKLNGEIK